MKYFIDTTQIARELGLYTTGNRPHVSLVGALLKEIEATSYFDEAENVMLFPSCVMPVLREYMYKKTGGELPEQLRVGRRKFSVLYYTQKEGMELSEEMALVV